ncbi:Transcriptional regulator [Gracilaria domingensis]|nr:Transcriptional regulator [Gracilaria domingensis]
MMRGGATSAVGLAVEAELWVVGCGCWGSSGRLHVSCHESSHVALLLVCPHFSGRLPQDYQRSHIDPRCGPDTCSAMTITPFTSAAFAPSALGSFTPPCHSRFARKCSRTPANVYMGRRSEKIKHRKDAQSQAKAKVFARVGKMITMAAKQGGPDVVGNRALAEAIDAAKRVKFPKDTMEKAIARATSPDQAEYKKSSFEAYGHGGAAIYIDVLTDNPNRAAADIRTAINKSKFKIASPGSVAFNFERMGKIHVSKDCVQDEDDLFMAAVDAGAEECDVDPDDVSMYRILTDATALYDVQKALGGAGFQIELAQLAMVPKTVVTVSEEDMEKNMDGVDMIQSVEDVDDVFINATLE